MTYALILSWTEGEGGSQTLSTHATHDEAVEAMKVAANAAFESDGTENTWWEFCDGIAKNQAGDTWTVKEMPLAVPYAKAVLLNGAPAVTCPRCGDTFTASTHGNPNQSYAAHFVAAHGE